MANQRTRPNPAPVEPPLFQEFLIEFPDYWKRLPNKFFFFTLLAVWLGLFQVYGNGTFGYINTASLFRWMWNAYSGPMTEGQDAHGAIVPIAVLVLFWIKRKEIFALPSNIWSPGAVIVAFSLMLHFFGYIIQQPRVSIVALFLGIYGLMGLAWGVAWMKASFFPFFLFAFCIPISSISQGVTFPLRLIVSKLVHLISHGLVGMPVERIGTQLRNTNAGYAYDVAAACSGIQSLMAIVGFNTVVAFVFLKDWKRRAIMIAASIPLAILSNVTRLLMVVFAAEWIDREAGNWVHDNAITSLIPYIPAIGGTLLLRNWLEEPDPVGPTASASPTPSEASA